MMDPTMRPLARLLAMFLFISLLPIISSPAAVVRLDWSPSTAPDLAGYHIRYGSDGATFPDMLAVPDPDATSWNVTGLTVGVTYNFVIQAYDTSYNLSGISEVVFCEGLPWNIEAAPPQVPVIVGLDQPVFRVDWDVSNFDCSVHAGFEVSKVNQGFADPNGTEWDPGSRCADGTMAESAGYATMDASVFQGPGIYQIRVAALDQHGTIICRWSDSACLEVIAGAPLLPDLIVAGPGPGPDNPPRVRLFDPLAGSPDPVLDFLAYGVERYGVNVSAGDVTGDGLLNIITGPGPGREFGPQVRVFDRTGASIHADFFAYSTEKWGVNCATGNIDGLPGDEIITTPGPGEVFGPHVRGWRYDGQGRFQPMADVSYMAYGTHKYGANAVCGDIDGDGIDEIITGAGPGAVFGPHVRGWNYDGEAVAAIPGISFLAYGTNKFGVNVACGDVDGDGFDEIVTGAGPGEMFGPHVRGFDYDGYLLETLPGASFFAGDHLDAYGVNVSCGDIDGDGVDEIITAPGPGDGEAFTARIMGWNYSQGEVVGITGLDFLAFDEDHQFGARVGMARGVR